MPEVKVPAKQIDATNTHVDPETNTYQFDDDAALRLVIEDRNNIDAWMNLQQWASQWQQADMLEQSPTSNFDGLAGVTVPKFTLSNIVSAVVPKMMGALNYNDPAFVARPRPGTKPGLVRAKEALFSYQLDEMKFWEEVEAGLHQMSLLGTGIWKWGWRKKKKTIRKYVREAKQVPVNTPMAIAHVSTPDSDKFHVELEEKDIEHPWFEFCDIRTVRVTPGTRRGDIRKAKAVLHTLYPTWKEIEDLRQIEGYDIPTEEELREFFLKRHTPKGDNITMTMPESMRGYLQHAYPRNYKETEDPFQNGPELTERVDADKVIVVLTLGEHHFLVRNEPNEYGKINFYSANWRDLQDAFYGQGLGQLVGYEQMVDQGTTALALGMLAYGLQPTAVRKKGFNAISQPTVWEQGGIIDVEDDVDKAYKFLEFPRIPPEAFAMVQQSQATAAETAGANQQTTMGAGAAGIKTTGMRSGTGAALVGQANASRLDGPMERFIRQVFIPWLYQMDELNNEKLPTHILTDILGEELGNEVQIDHIEFRNAQMEYDVLAGAHLGAVKEMAQFMPFVLNLVNNPTLMELAAEQGIGFNFKAWFDQFADLAHVKWAQDFFVPLTPQQKQQRMLNSPAGVQAAKGQQARSLEVQKFQQEQQLVDQEQLGKAAGEAQRLVLEHALQSEQGIPGVEGM